MSWITAVANFRGEGDLVGTDGLIGVGGVSGTFTGGKYAAQTFTTYDDQVIDIDLSV